MEGEWRKQSIVCWGQRGEDIISTGVSIEMRSKRLRAGQLCEMPVETRGNRESAESKTGTADQAPREIAVLHDSRRVNVMEQHVIVRTEYHTRIGLKSAGQFSPRLSLILLHRSMKLRRISLGLGRVACSQSQLQCL
jgi:hypothetical protein